MTWVLRCRRSIRPSPTKPGFGGCGIGGPGGRGRGLVADFLIGAHALAAADRFLTRDRGFYASYFAEMSTSAGILPAGGEEGERSEGREVRLEPRGKRDRGRVWTGWL